MADSRGPTNPQNASNDNVHILLAICKWSLLGMYLFLEMFTIIDAVTGRWAPWAVAMQNEALKFWFYGLAASVLLDVYELFIVIPTLVRAKFVGKSGPPNEKPETVVLQNGKDGDRIQIKFSATSLSNADSARAKKRQQLYKQLVIDGCDLLIPGTAVGWLPLDPITTGVAGTISAIMGGSQAWERVNP
jgi:hypothetical protein